MSIFPNSNVTNNLPIPFESPGLVIIGQPHLFSKKNKIADQICFYVTHNPSSHIFQDMYYAKTNNLTPHQVYHSSQYSSVNSCSFFSLLHFNNLLNKFTPAWAIFDGIYTTAQEMALRRAEQLNHLENIYILHSNIPFFTLKSYE